MLVCIACGRSLSNDPAAPNAARWTYAWSDRDTRYPFCADSQDCQRDAEDQAGL